MKKILISLGILGLFLISGCVSDVDYNTLSSELTATKTKLENCKAKECPKCEEVEETKIEVIEGMGEPYFKECPYECPDSYECAEIFDSEGKLKSWQCVTEAFV